MIIITIPSKILTLITVILIIHVIFNNDNDYVYDNDNGDNHENSIKNRIIMIKMIMIAIIKNIKSMLMITNIMVMKIMIVHGNDTITKHNNNDNDIKIQQ